VSQHFASLSIGGYIVLTVVPLILLAVWGIAMYRADRYPEWRHGTQAQAQITGAGGVELGRAVPGPLSVQAEAVSRTEDQPDRP
jgi:hypothetical protein